MVPQNVQPVWRMDLKSNYVVQAEVVYQKQREKPSQYWTNLSPAFLGQLF
jgi:hypothetical protein